MIAKRSCIWECDGTKYNLIEGELISLSKKDLEKAKASNLFKEEDAKPNKRRNSVKAEATK